uniref:ribosomal protein S12 n=1 Tax=Hydnora arabica TaxID=2952646 RepID=UPI002114C71F|nr:ribosomal protein S12 [Hydnora arabica]USN93614.1 ribosomal protein S12 [Hydnora arabica]
MISLKQIFKKKKYKPILKNSKKNILKGHPQLEGKCKALYTLKPKKPNSALRKVARVQLSSGPLIVASIPGIGHDLKIHSHVLIRGGRIKDLPGVKYRIIRGTRGAGGVQDRFKGRSKYGVKKNLN